MTPQSRPLELVNVEPENAPKPAPALTWKWVTWKCVISKPLLA
jgi:hypothetical protein